MKKASTPSTAETQAARPRGRPRLFDREAALDAAMQVFWIKGYEGASIAALTEAMGINPPSLYAAFGDKEQLFLEAVERYVNARVDSCPYAAERTAYAAMERLLTYMAQELTETAKHPGGCMMMMAAATSANASPKLQKALADMRAAGRERIRARIKRGIADGDVPPGTDAGALADFYSAILTGMSQQARDGASRRSLLATAERAMSLFPAPVKSSQRARATA